MIKINKANLADTTQLVSIINTSLGYNVAENTLRIRIQQILNRYDHLLLVAKIDDQVVGFCHGYLRLLTEVIEAIEIGGLAVAEAHRGKGVAKQLIRSIEEWAKSLDCKQIVLASNIIRTEAHAFYEHLGYKKIKQQFAFEKNL